MLPVLLLPVAVCLERFSAFWSGSCCDHKFHYHRQAKNSANSDYAVTDKQPWQSSCSWPVPSSLTRGFLLLSSAWCCQWIYDIWYSQLTPDKEFPAEVRRLLNTAFGQLASRARRLDLRVVMNDLCELCMEQVGSGWLKRTCRIESSNWMLLLQQQK